MTDFPPWQYDEMKPVGKDYSSIAEVEAYDSRHSKFRDIQKENEFTLDRISLRKEDIVIDLGTGTGAFAIEASKRCSEVYAVDVSREMLAYAKKKADSSGVGNITFCHGGFLTYEHSGDPADVVFTSVALHHLPDFWKFLALKRINAMLKHNGKLVLIDVVFSGDDHETSISKWIADMENLAGPEMAKDIQNHIREEYSTFTWIMEGLLSRSGFRIDEALYQSGVIARYFCSKIKSCP